VRTGALELAKKPSFQFRQHFAPFQGILPQTGQGQCVPIALYGLQVCHLQYTRHCDPVSFVKEDVLTPHGGAVDGWENNVGQGKCMKNKIYFGDNLEVLQNLPSESVDLIYIDPPFNTKKVQGRTQIKTIRSEDGDRVGFQGKRYETVKIGAKFYSDIFDDFLSFLEPRLKEAQRILSPIGSMYFHIDYREVHYCKILLDTIFGRESFLNEIIWAYDYGARSKKKWSAKHDNILVYVKNPDNYIFNYDEVERIPYMAPGLVGEEKAEKGKTLTDTWWHTIVPTHGKEKTGYPTQKPLGILRRIVKVSSKQDSIILDFFAGSGTTGVAALENNRNFILADKNPESLEVMAKRFDGVSNIEWINFDPTPFQKTRRSRKVHSR
jgi:site-specific DNA-methyltransferase (adenine-specific)